MASPVSLCTSQGILWSQYFPLLAEIAKFQSFIKYKCHCNWKMVKMDIRGRQFQVPVQAPKFYLLKGMMLWEIEGIRAKESLQLQEIFCFLMIQLRFRNRTAGLRDFRTELLKTNFSYFYKHYLSIKPQCKVC